MTVWQFGELSLETSLYLPVKNYLENFGFSVKGEIGGSDLVGLRGDGPQVVVVCELKMSFNLELILQAVARAPAADEIWIAARISKRGKGREADARYRNLCRRLGFGMLTVAVNGDVGLIVSPAAPMPPRDKRRGSQLVEEHKRRRGDPVAGGGSRAPIMTAYRQQALACAAALALGPRRPRELKADLPDAPKILLRNVYGWFSRADRGLYELTEQGRGALIRWPQVLEPEKPSLHSHGIETSAILPAL